MTLDACAALVARGDPDRFAAVMAAPLAARAQLLPLYAFNLEVARAPWASAEPLIAEMRLQFWRDVVTEPHRRAHEVAGPLRDLMDAAGLPEATFLRLIDARALDREAVPFADSPSLVAYLEATGGGLMWLAAEAVGAPPEAEAPARDLGRAAALAGYFRAVPELVARGRVPLPAGDTRGLAREGLGWLARGRAGRGVVGAAALAAWTAGPILRQAVADPRRIEEGALGLSEFRRRSLLLWAAATGRV